ncbi:hypothetical protein [Microbacterium hydrocarbonoxydans]|uniref:hypothetical protein n=1 Tax=Microbacterium hydrocarbonoxydans TaxID=273678 RepID=UPI0013DD1C48|nr:hypothetical protein [Microbacterium hydrocarbonoxydans]
MDNPLIFFAIIIAIVIIAILMPRWIGRSTRAAGSRTGRRFEDRERERTLHELGTTIVIHAPASVAREIVDEVVRRQPRKFTVLGDRGYGIRFVEEDDAIARLAPDPDGTRLQIEQSREHLGMPKGARFWKDLRDRVASEAGAREISVAEGVRNGFRSDGGRPAVWGRAEDE